MIPGKCNSCVALLLSLAISLLCVAVHSRAHDDEVLTAMLLKADPPQRSSQSQALRGSSSALGHIAVQSAKRVAQAASAVISGVPNLKSVWECELTDTDCFHLLSMNMYMRPTTFLINGQLTRAANAPNEMDGFDAICFQELFDGDARAVMINGLKAKGYHSFTSPLEGTALTNGGVMIASKHKIELERQIIYKKCVDTDCMASKGAKYAKINKGGKQFHLFCTHVQAQAGETDVKVRASQFKELGEFVHANTKDAANELVIVAGDLNFNLFSSEVATLKTSCHVDFPWPQNCAEPSKLTFNNLFYGTAPFCDPKPSDCTHDGGDVQASDGHKDNTNKCLTGSKLNCKVIAPSSCSVFSYDQRYNEKLGGKGGVQWLDFTTYSVAPPHAQPSCSAMRVRKLQFSDHFPVEGVFHLTKCPPPGTVEPPLPPEKKRKWIGTAPQCEPKPSECPTGYHVKYTDQCGDGECCLSGHKILCEAS